MSDRIRIPSGFWKVVVYVDKHSKKLACQAYAMYQDAQFTADKRGAKKVKAKNYQVTITELEKVTGLEFAKELFDNNPLYFFPRDGVNAGPEAFITPRSIRGREPDLAEGVVFSRDEADSPAFTSRKSELTISEFNEFISSGGVA